MKIDFHTHIFPEKIAARALMSMQNGLERNYGQKLPTYTDATVMGLCASMEKAGIDLSVVLPIATTPKQTESINEYAKTVTGGGLISFGSVYPGQSDWERVLENLADDGFLGIKLHPEYQQFYVDSRESIDIINKCRKLGLTVVFHAGVDLGICPPVHCTPQRLRHVLEYTEGDNIVAAHLGGFELWDDVMTYLVGTNVIFDTSMLSAFADKEICAKIIKAHGFGKVVCGSDSPWEAQGSNRKFLYEMGFDDAELGKMDETAKRLLRM